MNKYEVMFIVNTGMESAAASKIAEDYSKLVKNDKGSVEVFKDLGQRKLAYEIDKQITGFYYYFDCTAKTDTIKELDRRLRLDENIVRHMIVRIDEE